MSEREMADERRSGKEVSAKRMPVKTFRAGVVSAAVWRHTEAGRDGREMASWSVTLDKRYRDKEGIWKSSRSLNVNDIPKAVVALENAYSYVVCEAKDDDNTPF